MISMLLPHPAVGQDATQPKEASFTNCAFIASSDSMQENIAPCLSVQDARASAQLLTLALERGCHHSGYGRDTE
jgi:hypothetical protein